MPWPSSVTAGVSRVLASQYDDLLAGVQAWPAGVSAGGYALADIGGASFHTTNAAWQEFQLRPVAGAGVATDAIVFQYNARATIGGADAWADVWKVKQSDGSLIFANTVTFLGAVTGLPTATTLTPGILSASDYATFLAASAAGTSWTVDVRANAQNLLFNTVNTAWMEFALGSVAGASAAADSLQLKVNARSSSGGSDSWFSAISIASQTGALTVSTAVALNAALTFNTGANLNGQTFSGNATFSGALTMLSTTTSAINLAGVLVQINGNPSFTGPVRFDNPLTTFNGNATTVGLLSVNGSLKLNSSVSCNGQFFLGAANFSGNVSFVGGSPEMSVLLFKSAAGTPIGQLYADGFAGTFSLNYYASGSYFSAIQIAAPGGGVTMNTPVAANSSFSIAQANNISIGSNWTAWTPGMSTGASYSGYAILDAAYFRIGAQVHFKIAVNVTFTGTTNYIALSLPFAAQGPSQVHASMIGPNSNSYVAGACYSQGSGSATLLCYLPGWVNYGLTIYYFFVSGCYQA